MSLFTAADVAGLPAPELITAVNFEQTVLTFKAELLEAMNNDPDVKAVLALESEPLVKLLELMAYKEVLRISKANALIKSMLLAFAKGADLDQIGANHLVLRRLIKAADDSVSPPAPAVYESDAEYLDRILLSSERVSCGSRGCYLFHALDASAEVQLAEVETPSAGAVNLYIKARNSEQADSELLTIVFKYLCADRKPFTDHLNVLSAEAVAYSVTAELTLLDGFDDATTLQLANDSLSAYQQRTLRLGYNIDRSEIIAALHVAGVKRVNLLTPNADIDISNGQYGICTHQNIVTVGQSDA